MTTSRAFERSGLADMKAADILDSLPDGVYITDTNRRILFWNREAERLTGWRSEEVVGHCCHENILCHIDKDGHLLCGHEHCPLHRAMVTGESSELPHLIFAKCRDGRRIPVEVSVSPVRGEGGEVIGGVEVFRDLSPAFVDLNRARIIQQDNVQTPREADARVALDVRYTPHDQVGGDFYRIERLDADRYALLVTDVVGHGVAAALYTMQVRALWEEGRSMLGDPAAFMAWLSRRVRGLCDTEHGYFATAVHVVFHAGTGELLYAVAGHPPPALIRASGRVEQLGTGGPALGLFPEPEYRNVRRHIDVGEHLLLFTDGAFEIMNAKGMELDMEPFLRLVQETSWDDGAAALDHLEESLLRYSNALSLPDDLTLIHLGRG